MKFYLCKQQMRKNGRLFEYMMMDKRKKQAGSRVFFFVIQGLSILFSLVCFVNEGYPVYYL